jgi:hypothetical protein
MRGQVHLLQRLSCPMTQVYIMVSLPSALRGPPFSGATATSRRVAGKSIAVPGLRLHVRFPPIWRGGMKKRSPRGSEIR